LNQSQWQDLQTLWLQQGGIPECTSSVSMTNIKVFIENVCSQYTCDYQMKQALIQGFEKIAILGK